jgi:hypothetical protein
MPATLKLTPETVQRLAPDAQVLQSARDLVRKKSYLHLGISADGTWLLAQCKGSTVYDVSIDLAGETAPVGRCSCPSRKLPCKHVLGLMFAYLESPGAFAEREPPADLVAKRDKQAQRAQKQSAGKAAPRKVNTAALAKKTAAQREGLDLLEKLVVDLVAQGQWFEPSRLERLERQARQMSDAYLPGAMVLLRRLAILGSRQDLTDEERTALASDLIGQLWATVKKGRNYLDGKLAGDEAQAEADAVVEEVLGHAWQLAELRDKGYLRHDLRLLELAYERYDDDARQERVETSHLIDLDAGGIFRAVTYRPFKGLARIAEQPSYTQALTIGEAAVYPGFLNRRIRWEKAAERAEALTPAHLAAAHAGAAPAFEPVLAAYRQQLKHPLAPREAVVLLRSERVGKVGDRVVLGDAQGARLEAVDRTGGYSEVANLVRATGMLRQQPAVLARLVVRPLANAIAAQPLAVLTPELHLRLGL